MTTDTTTTNGNIIRLNFDHVNNGIIIGHDGMFPMIEFKLVQNNVTETKQKILFKHVGCDSAWFIVDVGESGERQLIGPIGTAVEEKSGKIIINDSEFPDVHELEISSVTNEPADMILEKDLPHWMLTRLTSSFYIANEK